MSGEKCLLRRPIVGEVAGPSDVDGKLPEGRCETEQPVLQRKTIEYVMVLVKGTEAALIDLRVKAQIFWSL